MKLLRVTKLFLLCCALVLGSLPLRVFAVPPSSPYQPGETIAPACAPSSTNCTVRGYAATGANSDITSISGLTTALSVPQGGTGLASYNLGDILYASGPTTIAGLGLGTAGSVLSLVNGLPVWQATSSLNIVTDSLVEGVNKFYTDTKVLSYLNTLSKEYFFSTSSINTWKGTQDFFSAASSTAWLLTKSTSDLGEGVNKYFTDARADARISATSTIATLLSLPNLTSIGTVTSGVWNGTPIDASQYLSNLDIPLATLLHSTTTDALTEGALHKYYDDAKVSTLLDTISKSYFFSTSSANTWKETQDFFSAASSTAWLLTKTTDDLTEGTRKYFTDARADARISATSTIATLLSVPNLSTIGTITSGTWNGSPIDAVSYVSNLSIPFATFLQGTTTDALSEGTLHKYYSNSQVLTYLDSIGKSYFFSTSSADTWKGTRDFFSSASSTAWLLTKTTADLAEGTNKYFTDARADARISATSTIATLLSLPNLATIGTVTSGVWHGSPIDATSYVSNLSSVFNSFLGATTTDALAEGTRKYYTDARVASYIISSSSIPHISGGSTGELLAWTGSAWTSRATSTLAIALSDTKGTLTVGQGGTGLTSITSGSLLTGNGTGSLVPISVGSNGQTLSLVGGVPTWIATTTFSGGLTYAGGNVSITNGSLTNAQLQNSSFTLSAGSGLSGGTTVSLGGSGSLSLDLTSANTWTGLQQFSNASSSNLSISGTTYFGSGGATSISSAGDLTLGAAGTNAILSLNASGKLVASSTPTVATLIATSTTATSTFAGGFAVGTNKLVVDRSTGNVGIGTASPSSALSVVGKVAASLGFNGSCFAGSQQTSLISLVWTITTLDCNKDLAESYPSYEPTEAGDVVALPPDIDAEAIAEVGKARGVRGETLLGVVSTNPGLVFHNNGTFLAGDNNNLGNASTSIIALSGRVPVKISLENGPIHPGDDLVASHTPGFAMRAKGPGTVIGTALGSYPNETAGTDAPIVMVFVNLHWSPGHMRSGEGTASSTAFISDFGYAVQDALSEFGITLMEGFLQVKEIITDRLTTKELCLQDVCITRDDLEELLQKNSVSPALIAPFASSSDPAPEDPSEEVTPPIDSPVEIPPPAEETPLEPSE